MWLNGYANNWLATSIVWGDVLLNKNRPVSPTIPKYNTRATCSSIILRSLKCEMKSNIISLVEDASVLTKFTLPYWSVAGWWSILINDCPFKYLWSSIRGAFAVSHTITSASLYTLSSISSKSPINDNDGSASPVA